MTETALDKTFDPATIEAKWYAHWERNGLFRPERPDAQPYTIVNPPPNVTGSLHVGHALDNTLQDIMIRYERLRGRDALWVVGTDHAGIATQMVVERKLEERQDKRTNYTREAFVEKVWEWKEESGGTITGQLRRLGCSMDWSREQFTMSPAFTRAVTRVFVDLYNEGLIYRDKRLVNWDPKLKTAISDLEVETREVQGQFWHLRYPLADGVRLADGADHLVVATTRPETLLADMAVAVNPADPRYQTVIGRFVTLPITGRRIPIVADEHADPELGSGAVKITPGHDFNDFEVGRRADIEARDMLNMLDAEARVVQVSDGLIPTEFVGLDRFDARKAVVAAMDALGLLVEVEPRTIQTPYGDRGGVVIEPWLTDQWYVDAKTLAQPAMQAVRDGRIEIVPKSWEKTYFNWMENIQPWCVSRQLWWGHRIPAWYGPSVEAAATGDASIAALSSWQEGHRIVAESEEVARVIAAHDYGVDASEIHFAVEQPAGNLQGRGCYTLRRDPDVLDTWFSSALWPFATLGWPDAVLDKSQPVRAEPVEAPSFSSNEVPSVEEQDGPSTSSGWTGSGRSLAHATDREPSHPPEGGGSARGSDAGGDAQSGEVRDPLSPLKGKGENTLLARHYPNDLLISGFDILFFWDARMAMMGLQFMGPERSDPKDKVPWRRLYLHGLVRAADGAKMSKSKGNVVDPLGLIDRYGADALRFFMAAMESQGRDVKMDERRLEGYRNFATKLWNAARFCQSNGIGASASVAAPPATSAVNRWIVGEVVETLAILDKALADLRFDAAANAIYHFVWDTFCDWYLELVKPVLSVGVAAPSTPLPLAGGAGGGPFASTTDADALPSGDGMPTPDPSRRQEGSDADETRAVAGWVLDQILVMLHPFMPFVTEELWNAMGERDNALIVAQWPEPGAMADAAAKAEVEWLIALTGNLRTAKAELGIAPGARLEAFLPEPSDATRAIIAGNAGVIERVARLSAIRFETPPAGAAMQVGAGDANLAIPLAGVIDLGAEQARLAKALAASEKERDNLAKRLDNPAFVGKAKPEAIDKARSDHAAHAAEAERLAAALARLG